MVREWDNRGLIKVEVVAKLPVADAWEIGWWWVRVGRLAAAAALAEDLGRANAHGTAAEAAQLLSLVQAARLDWPAAITQADAAVRSYDAFDYARQDGKRRERLLRHRQQILRLRDLAVHGVGYVLLCEANCLRLAGNLESARVRYDELVKQASRNAGRPFIPCVDGEDPALADQPISAAFTDAAVVHRLACIVGDRRNASNKAAEDAVRAIVTGESPFAPFAALTLAERAFRSGDDPAECLHLFDAAIGRVAKTTLDLSPAYVLPEATARAVAVEGPMRPVTAWAQAEWFKEEPDRLYAPPWCAWFADYVGIRARHGRAAARFAAGDVRGALEDVEATAKADPADYKLYQDGMPSNYARLRDGFQRGRFYATRDELAQFKGLALRRLLWVEIAMETERWSDAVAGYDSLIADPSLGLTQGARAYLDYAKASALIFQGKTQLAEMALASFDGPRPTYRGTPSYWRAVFAHVSILPADKAPMALAAALDDGPPDDVRIDLLMNLGETTYGLGRNADATVWFSKLLAIEPKGWRAVAARTFLTKIAAGGISADRGKPDSP